MADRSPRPPLVVHPPEVTRSLAARLQITHLLTRYSERPIWALFMFLNGFITIALLAAVAMVSRTPFVFPSLGPTAFLFFFTPRAPAASPRHTIYGHAIGIVCGYGALWLFGLQHAPPAMATGVSLARVGAAALSLASTGALMILAQSGAPARRRDDPHHLARDRDTTVPPARDRDRRRHPDAAGDRHQPARRHRLSALGAERRSPLT